MAASLISGLWNMSHFFFLVTPVLMWKFFAARASQNTFVAPARRGEGSGSDPVGAGAIPARATFGAFLDLRASPQARLEGGSTSRPRLQGRLARVRPRVPQRPPRWTLDGAWSTPTPARPARSSPGTPRGSSPFARSRCALAITPPESVPLAIPRPPRAISRTRSPRGGFSVPRRAPNAKRPRPPRPSTHPLHPRRVPLVG